MVTTRKEFTAKPEISALPKPIQEKLTDFIYKEIPKVRFFKPDGKPKAEWKIFYGDSWVAAWDAAWDAAWNAARNAARAAARDAALAAARKNAARNAARAAARDAAWVAALDTARVAAWVAALDTARVAALDASLDTARDAALCSYYILTSDLKFKDKEKHLKHVKARWEVWEKGYGLLCDVDGQLYVYSIKED